MYRSIYQPIYYIYTRTYVIITISVLHRWLNRPMRVIGEREHGLADVPRVPESSFAVVPAGGQVVLSVWVEV